MMRTKLTLRLEEELIAQAKDWAMQNNVSLSHLVAEYFQTLQKQMDVDSLDPWTQQFVGLIAEQPSDKALRQAHRDHLSKKHQ